MHNSFIGELSFHFVHFLFVNPELPGNFKNCVHVLAASPGDFTATVRTTMTAGGDNCSRLTFVGSCMGTYTGLAGT